MWEQVFQRV